MRRAERLEKRLVEEEPLLIYRSSSRQGALQGDGRRHPYKYVALVVDVAVVDIGFVQIITRAARARAEVVAVPVLIVGRARQELVLEAPPARAAHRELRGCELAALVIYKAPSVY